jgi:hypothetical protein
LRSQSCTSHGATRRSSTHDEIEANAPMHRSHQRVYRVATEEWDRHVCYVAERQLIISEVRVSRPAWECSVSTHSCVFFSSSLKTCLSVVRVSKPLQLHKFKRTCELNLVREQRASRCSHEVDVDSFSDLAGREPMVRHSYTTRTFHASMTTPIPELRQTIRPRVHR